MLIGIIWTGVTWKALALCGVLYIVHMFAVTAGYHRYFSHRTFKTSRLGQFVLAWLAQSSAQKSVLWWAAHHREHHKRSDTERDIHSPVQKGFVYSHVGWIFDPEHDDTDLNRVKDLARYPELRFLHRFELLPAIVTGVLSTIFFGWVGLFVGFFLSTVLVWHCTFFINSLAHVFGKKRFQTDDESRNSLFLALLTFGEGWHNNHHYHQSSTRQGFYWYEIDLTYMALKVLSWFRIVWDLREPPQRVLDEGRELDKGRRTKSTKDSAQRAIDLAAGAALTNTDLT
ncbi:MAG: acyl-CoA desaturase [Myxococcales bacterium]|nr:acyl-CoA desaturase [Myxococcales bacterium]